MDGAPPWYLGTIAWGGRRVPLVSFEAICGRTPPRMSGRTRIVIMQGITGFTAGGHFAVLTQGFPQLVRLSPDVIHADDSRTFDDRSARDLPGAHGQRIPDRAGLRAPRGNDRRGNARGVSYCRSPQSACSTVSATMPAVSVRSTRGPSRTGVKPAWLARSSSASSSPPSGPINSSARAPTLVSPASDAGPRRAQHEALSLAGRASRGSAASSSGARTSGTTLRPHCSQAPATIACQCRSFFAACRSSSRTTLRAESTGTIVAHAEFRRLLQRPVHALAARHGLHQRDAQRRLRQAGRVARRRARAHGRPSTDRISQRYSLPLPSKATAPRLRAGAARARRDTRPRQAMRTSASVASGSPTIDTGHSHVAASMPSRAVATSRSISSGVITYGGMK